MKYGFTGTSERMAHIQLIALIRFSEQLLTLPRPLLAQFVPTELHHGDCVNADKEANDIFIVKMPSVLRVAHPCTIEGMRAHCDVDMTCDVKRPLVRNRIIARTCDRLIACPPTTYEIPRSGSWATIRYFRELKKPIVTILPDGVFLYEGYWPVHLTLESEQVR